MKKPSAKTLALVFRTALGLALLITAGAIMAFLVATKPQVSKSGFDEQSLRVQVIRVEPIDVPRQWRGYGTTQPVKNRSSDVPARVGATVILIPDGIEVGTVVKKDQILAELDKTDFQNVFDAAEKRMAEIDAAIDQLAIEDKRLNERLVLEEKSITLAQADLDRQRERLKNGSATQSDIDRVERALLSAQGAALATRQQIDLIPSRKTGLEATKAAVKSDRDTAKANLDRATIKSPIDGIIEALDVEEGENLTPGARVARIIDPRVLEVPIQLPASARSYIDIDEDRPIYAIITPRNPPEGCPPWKAKVTRKSGSNQSTRTFTVFAQIDQSSIPLEYFAKGGGPEHRLAVGAFVLAQLDTYDTVQRLILPDRAIQEGRVRTVIDGKVVAKTVEVAYDLEQTFPRFGVPDDQWVVLIMSDTPQPKKGEADPTLRAGDLVVLSASMSILDGQRVEPTITNDKADADGDDTKDQGNDGGAS